MVWSSIVHDTQLYISSKSDKRHQLNKIENRIMDIKQWMLTNFLYLILNIDVLALGPNAVWSKLSVSPCEEMKDHGVIIIGCLLFEAHVNAKDMTSLLLSYPQCNGCQLNFVFNHWSRTTVPEQTFGHLWSPMPISSKGVGYLSVPCIMPSYSRWQSLFLQISYEMFAQVLFNSDLAGHFISHCALMSVLPFSFYF